MDPRMPPMQPGQMVDVIALDDESETPTVWLAKIKGGQDSDTEFTVSEPELKDGSKMPYERLPLPVRCRIPKDAFVWSFETVVRRVVNETFVLELPDLSEIKREQRRGHVRADVDLPGSIALRIAGRYFGQSACRVTNLSGGGCSIEGDKPFVAHSTMKLTIELPNHAPIDAIGRIVRASPFPGPQGQYGCGFMFSEIDETDREDLIKFIFERMRHDLRMGRTGP